MEKLRRGSKIKRGLTLGKFAPLHKGHQLVIETALEEMDEVVVIIYDCPKTTHVPLTVRSGWLKKLYPQIRVIKAWDGPEQVGDSPRIRKMHEDYVLRRLKLEPRTITHFYSSEFYGGHMSRTLGAQNRQVDPSRKTVPISGSQIRKNPHANRKYVHPLVYRDLITTVVFLGAPSTGKTTIASCMAEKLETSWMPEHGRYFWEINQEDRRLTPDQLEVLAKEHIEKEDNLWTRADRFLFVDTNALTTYVFSQYYHEMATEGLEKLAEQSFSRYDIVFLCDTDIPYENTWDRSGEANRYIMQKRIRDELIRRKISFFLLSGDLQTRMARVRAVLERYPKYTNPFECISTP